MSKGKRLTEKEQGQIDLLRRNEFSERQIAESLGRSKTLIHQYLLDPSNYGKNMKKTHKKKTGERTIKKIIRFACKGFTSTGKIKAEVGCKVHKRTILRYLNDSKYLKYQKANSKPPLNGEHKKKPPEICAGTLEMEQRVG